MRIYIWYCNFFFSKWTIDKCFERSLLILQWYINVIVIVICIQYVMVAYMCVCGIVADERSAGRLFFRRRRYFRPCSNWFIIHITTKRCHSLTITTMGQRIPHEPYEPPFVVTTFGIVFIISHNIYTHTKYTSSVSTYICIARICIYLWLD